MVARRREPQSGSLTDYVTQRALLTPEVGRLTLILYCNNLSSLSVWSKLTSFLWSGLKMNPLICFPMVAVLLVPLHLVGLMSARFGPNNCAAMGTRATIKANKCTELNKKCTSLFFGRLFLKVLVVSWEPPSPISACQNLGKGGRHTTRFPAARKSNWWQSRSLWLLLDTSQKEESTAVLS